MRRGLLGFLASIVIVFLSAGASAADIESEWDWDIGGVQGAGWGKESNTGVWSNLATLGDGPYIYNFELVCFDENAGYIDCLAGNACEAAPGGKYVLWKRSPREISPPVWGDFAGNGPACVYSEDPDRLLEEIHEELLREFQQQPVSAGKVMTQPGPHTMIGAETNVYVDAQEQIINTVLMQQSVKIVATPTEYELHYGDGSTNEVSWDPGAKLPESRIGQQTATSHAYASTGNFRIYATVYFTGAYSLNNGPMIPLDGRGVFETPAETISVWRSESRNVADNCLQNPAGFGC